MNEAPIDRVLRRMEDITLPMMVYLLIWALGGWLGQDLPEFTAGTWWLYLAFTLVAVGGAAGLRWRTRKNAEADAFDAGYFKALCDAGVIDEALDSPGVKLEPGMAREYLRSLDGDGS